MKAIAEEKTSILGFVGSPKVKTKREKRIWRAFIHYIKDKWELGNEYLSARVLKEKAQAINELTQSYKNIQEAKEIAHRIDANDTPIDFADIVNKEELIEDLMTEIIEDMKYLSAVHGTRINVEITKQLASRRKK